MFDAFNGTVSRIYAAAADPALWVDAMIAVEDLTGSAGATLNLVPVGHGGGAVLAGRLPVETCEEYARDYMAICPRTRWVHTHPGCDIAVDAMVMTEAEMDRDPVYAFFARQDLRYFVGGTLPSIVGYRPNFSLQRSRGQGHVQADTLHLFETLRGHVARAVTLGSQLAGVAATARATESLLDTLPHGVMVLGRHGQLLFANAAADRILSANDGLRLTDGVPTAERAADRDALGALLRAACAGAGHGAGGGWTAVRRSRGHGPYALFAAPLTGDTADALADRPAAALVVHDPLTPLAPSATMLTALFDLTPTEARLAALIANGVWLGEAARRQGHSEGTARIHLKSIFRKMAVQRQQDLATLVARLTAGIGGRG